MLVVRKETALYIMKAFAFIVLFASLTSIASGEGMAPCGTAEFGCPMMCRTQFGLMAYGTCEVDTSDNVTTEHCVCTNTHDNHYYHGRTESDPCAVEGGCTRHCQDVYKSNGYCDFETDECVCYKIDLADLIRALLN